MTLWLERGCLQRLADRQRRQPALLVVLGRLVASRLVGLEKPWERDHGAACTEGRRPIVGGRGTQLDRDRLAARVLHLGRDGPLEDEVVERVLVTRELAAQLVRRSEDVSCGPDGLVCLLRVRNGALVAPRLGRNRVLSVHPSGVRTRGRQSSVRQRHGVGSHVGDVAVLVQALSETHRRLGREAELAARFLLQRGGAERCRGSPCVGLLVDALDGERPSFQRVCESSCRILGEHEDRGRKGCRLRRSPGPARLAFRRRPKVAPRTSPARRCRECPSRKPRRTACAAVRGRRRAGSRPTARGRRRVWASPSSRGRGRPRTRRGGRESVASPARRRACRRCCASPRRPARWRPS